MGLSVDTAKKYFYNLVQVEGDAHVYWLGLVYTWVTRSCSGI